MLNETKPQVFKSLLTCLILKNCCYKYIKKKGKIVLGQYNKFQEKNKKSVNQESTKLSMTSCMTGIKNVVSRIFTRLVF